MYDDYDTMDVSGNVSYFSINFIYAFLELYEAIGMCAM